MGTVRHSFEKKTFSQSVPPSFSLMFAAWKKRFASLKLPFQYNETFSRQKLSEKLFLKFFVSNWEKWLSSLMRVLSGIFRHWKIEKFLTTVSFAYLRNLVFWTLRGAPTWAVPSLFLCKRCWYNVIWPWFLIPQPQVLFLDYVDIVCDEFLVQQNDLVQRFLSEWLFLIGS